MPKITEIFTFTGLTKDGVNFRQQRAHDAEQISYILPDNHNLVVGDEVPVGCEWIGRGF